MTCDVALQVKQGAENMISMYTQMRDKKMLLEAQQMLEDARTKIEIVRMQMLRVQQAGKQQQQQNNTTQDNNSHEVSLQTLLTRLSNIRLDLEKTVLCTLKSVN